jgi:hypothetical protein
VFIFLYISEASCKIIIFSFFPIALYSIYKKKM